MIRYLCDRVLTPKFGGQVEVDELGLPVTQTGLVLPTGVTARWSK